MVKERKMTNKEKIIRLRQTLCQIDNALHIPAAEYVPTIRDVFTIIDQVLKETA